MISDIDELKRLWHEPLRLFRLSNALRQKNCRDAVSFVINRNINFTNKCIGTCRFCSFKHDKTYFLTHEQIIDRAGEAEEQGATEICLQGGLAPEMMLEDYCGILELIHRDFPRMHLHAYSPMEVLHMSRNSHTEVKETLLELKKSGLGSMPGTAAEILVDSVRQKICPDKLKAEEWRQIIRAAHLLGIPSTSTMLFGHVESLEDRLSHLMSLKAIQLETGGFTEMVLLPFIPDNNLLGKMAKGADLLDRLKMHALARVALYPNITNIQASWTKLGREAAAAALDWGANDLGGTLMDEGIARNSREAPSILAADLVELIEGQGKKAVQRTTLYERV
ncbi:MAG: 5-amino-6-(D-ribitylamino)uracil--L-tyrosine 4-hydroxyphenyl transferase CofH [Methanotrichaceae archaeon]|nr:5-amino-6-(D-ribitylamino)uracil--L-tyrosine 4-hydroxyphenyl transferase CofH [Methanotrichaceae archaeon]